MSCFRCQSDTDHETNYCRVYSKPGVFSIDVPRHHCCPEDCELNDEFGIQDNINYWEVKGAERGMDLTFMAEPYVKMLKFIRERDGEKV